MKATEKQETGWLLCVCGSQVETIDPAGWAKKNGWSYYPNSQCKDGVNAICAECKALDDEE